MGEFGFFDAGENLSEILVGIGGFVDGIFPAVEKNVVVVEFLVDRGLVEGSGRSLSAEASPRSVVHGVAAFFGSGESCHHDRTIPWISRQEDGMSGCMEGGVLEGKMTSGEGTGCALSVHPLGDSVDDFFSRDVMADEVNQLTFAPGEDFLKSLENELVDEEVIHGGEVGTESHVIEVGVSLGSSERRVNELLVSGGIGDAPLFKVSLESFELTLGQVIPESTRSAVREEGNLPVLETEDFGSSLGGGIFLHGDFFSLPKVVSATVGSELLGLGEEAVGVALAEHLGETLFECGDASIVSEVSGVLASFRPVGGDTESIADFFRGTLGHGDLTEFGIDLAAFFHGTGSFTGSGGSSVADGLDELASDSRVGDFVIVHIELQEGHRAFDIDPDGSGIDVSGRSHHAADGSPVSEVGIGVEDNLGHAGGGFAVSDLGDGLIAESFSDGFISDHGNGLALGFGGRNEGGGRAGDVDIGVHEKV
jgi:hypothetical protein